MSIDRETARKVAKLARIKVEEDALDALAGEFNAILGFVEQLNEVDVDGVEPMTSAVDMDAPLRSDDITDGGKRDAVLANAPKSEDGFYVVPRSVE